jgi:DNA-directed RNA polymerase sigma subunit (sigma70/sigma32)
MTDPYRVRVSVRNNLILQRIEEAGHDSIAAFCRSSGINLSTMHQLLAMKISPVSATNGEWRKPVQMLAEELRCLPDDLFTDIQRTSKLERAFIERTMSEEHVQALAQSGLGQITDGRPDLALMKKEAAEILSAQLGRLLAPREQKAVRLYFDLDGEGPITLSDLGARLGGVSGTRARQITMKAMRKLRHPKHAQELRGALASFEPSLEPPPR